MSKKKKSLLNYFIIFLFIVYLFIYVASKNGYITNERRNKMYFTNEQIEQFENDIELGKKVDIESYINNKKDYTNGFSNLGYNVSNGVVYIVNNTLKEIYSFILKFFT